MGLWVDDTSETNEGSILILSYSSVQKANQALIFLRDAIARQLGFDAHQVNV